MKWIEGVCNIRNTPNWTLQIPQLNHAKMIVTDNENKMYDITFFHGNMGFHLGYKKTSIEAQTYCEDYLVDLASEVFNDINILIESYYKEKSAK